MQARRRGGFRRRALFYWTNLYAKQLVRGGKYTALSPVVLIVFAGYRELEARRLHSTFQILLRAQARARPRNVVGFAYSFQAGPEGSVSQASS